MAIASIGAPAPASTPGASPAGVSLARLGAVLVAAARLAEDLEDEVTADGFALATALQCVVSEAGAQLRSAELALREGAAA